jgi:4-aminobutyrate aminotransferase-like enzyme
VVPDLTVVGKALANGFPLAAVAGRRDIVDAAADTWISSTLATEWVSLAAARAVIDTYRRDDVCGVLASVGGHWYDGLQELAQRHDGLVAAVRGVPTMCYLAFRTEAHGTAVARAMARREVLFKRSGYNFVSLAHSSPVVGEVLARLDAALREVASAC